MNKRFARLSLTVLVVLALALSFAGVALAFNSGDKPSGIGLDTITWTGQGATGGLLDTVQCDAQNDPNGANQPYLLWILTVDGGSIQNDATTPVLHLGGTGFGNYTTSNPSDNSAAHFVTPYFTPDSNLTAFADINILTTGSGAWNLVISHGCPGETVKDLTVSKTATPSYTRTFTWNIDKSVDNANVFTAGGAPHTFNYTVNVSHDTGTDSDWAVNGTITVHNPNSFDVTGVSLSDATSGGTCTVTPASVDVLAGSDANADYTCTFASNPGSGTNTATATWTDFGSLNTSATGSADYTFGDPTTIVDGNVSVTDTLGGTLGSVSYTDTSPTTFTYSKTFTDPAGTCTSHDNTATFTTSNTGTTSSASQTVTDCQGADLTVSKTAVPSYDLTYAWSIAKSVDPTTAKVDAGKPAAFNYTVTVTHDTGTESNWAVSGTITVANPNDWEAIDAHVSDPLCGLEKDITVPANGSVDVPYSCSLPSRTNGTNTATATWDAVAYHTPDASTSGSADYTFSDPTNVYDECVNVTDSVAGTLGTVCVGDANPKTFTYTASYNGPAAGTCANYNNMATFTTNDYGNTGSASASVQVCSYMARLTPGYWKNHLTFDSKNPQNPYVSKYLPQTLGTFNVTSTATVTAIFNGMNCSSTKDQDAVGCLAGHLLAAKFNVANGANPSIQATIDLADTFLKNISYIGPTGKYMLTSAQRAYIITLKTALDNYNNGK